MPLGSCYHSDSNLLVHCIRLSSFIKTLSIVLVMQREERSVTRMCPGFIADSAPRWHDNGGTIKLLQLEGLTVARGSDVWIETDSSEADKLGYHLVIHVSLCAY